jgi:hypothetical protein
MSEMGPPVELAGGGGGWWDMLSTGVGMANPLFGMGMQLLGGLLGSNNAQQGIDQLTQMSQSNPFTGAIGGLGSFNLNPNGPSMVSLDPTLAAGQGMLSSMLPTLFSGGPFMQQLMEGTSNMDLSGAMSQSDQALQQQANPFYNEANFANNMANVSQLGNMFSGNVANGGGARTQGMFDRGFGFMDQAQDVSGLINSRYDAMRTLAAPEEARIANNFFDREFMGTRGATTGAQDRRFNEASLANQRDAMRVMNSQELGLREQDMLRNTGMGMLGLGQANYGQEIAGAQGFGQLQAALENQGFMQNMGALQQNQSAGQQRIQTMLSMLGMGNEMFGSNMGLGIQGFGSMADLGLGMGGIVSSLLNADAARIGAQGYFAQPIAGLYADKGSFLSGLV